MCYLAWGALVCGVKEEMMFICMRHSCYGKRFSEKRVDQVLKIDSNQNTDIIPSSRHIGDVLLTNAHGSPRSAFLKRQRTHSSAKHALNPEIHCSFGRQMLCIRLEGPQILDSCDDVMNFERNLPLTTDPA